MDLGNTIKRIRTNKEIKQKDLAEACGMTQAYLSKIESNQKEPTIGAVRTIAEQLKVPLPVLFFQSMTSEDVAPQKREAFGFILPSIQSMIDKFF
ncbi:helix-turn-helix domain-containing protein [Mucilaginibacter sp. SMC90]|uniref:helix-turn-helix domain-containing protein n=1 Tax=Mucilaginibacter sp. SMC90 TaxID=2929803 RepID=UPI001FB3698A|nr:helix-turn-helix transcriptional regulator [Mucilaginibacter sp. SMC90]UOE52610.1 helix-turn-helix domain-containing protein [Mucilaginibacter sp. SMC90]